MSIVTERLADNLFEPFGPAFQSHRVDLPEVAINAYWHAKVHRSPVHQWLRGMVFDLCSDDQAAARPGSDDIDPQ